MANSNVLIVGAGAVGQVFGRHLQLAGANVSFFVKEKYKAQCEKGFDFNVLNSRNKEAVIHMKNFKVLCDQSEVKNQNFDQVYFTVSSPALQGTWLKELIEVSGNATLISMQPTAEDRQTFLAAGAAEEKLVSGLIAFISFESPLDALSQQAKAMAYWIPPLGVCPFSGPVERTKSVVQLLNAGGLKSSVEKNVPKSASFSTAILMSYIAALSLSNWSLKALAQGNGLAHGATAANEALHILSHKHGKPSPLIWMATWAWLIRMILPFAPLVVPFSLEKYLKKHFTKVSAQTRSYLRGTISYAKENALAHAALESLTS
jgi:ketopantoate reductase